MKHQYESEILFQLMERDGFNIPSSVPPYESEIKAYLINQVKLAYPKLTDYEAEWLLYNYTKHLPADFPISSATNVTEATFENVVPFAYQNVVLKGQTIGKTLPNLSTLKGEITLAPGSAQFSDSLLKNTTIYTVSFNCSSVPSTGTIEVRQVVGSNAVKMENKSVVQGYNQFIITSSSSGAERIRFKNDSTSTTDFVFNNLMIIEGDYTNVDIPYSEDINSVQMPGLTITGKNLFDKTTVVKGATLSGTTGGETLNDKRFTSGFIFVKNMKNITISLSSSITAKNVWGYDANKIATNKILASGFANKQTITIPDNIYYIKIPFGHVDDVIITDDIISNINIQIEEGLTATLYEPYKSNILTVNEEVELRGIDGVQDTLDCMTGELTQRIGEVVLDGTEDWTYEPTFSNENVYGCYILLSKMSQPAKPSNFNFANNVFPNITNSSFKSEGFATNQSTLSLRIAKAKLESVNLSGFKKYLQNHPVTLQYPLATESVKTVELKTVNESGESIHFMPLEGTMHVQSSGEIIQPTFDMSVPVEATTQNLASFIDLEMEE